jgi:hypothetical protein
MARQGVGVLSKTLYQPGPWDASARGLTKPERALRNLLHPDRLNAASNLSKPTPTAIWPSWGYRQ